MADIENKDQSAAVASEKETVESEAPAKVVGEKVDEDKVKNGNSDEKKESASAGSDAVTENGAEEKSAEKEDKKEDECSENKNGNKECKADTPTEAVKRKITGDSSEDGSGDKVSSGTDSVATPEKKAKLDDSTKEAEANGGSAEAEVTA